MSVTILPQITDRGNYRVLAEWLSTSRKYEYADGGLDTAEFDICILDVVRLELARETLRSRKQETDAILPYLLLVPDTTGAAIHRELRQGRPELWELVDDVIRAPIAEYELEGRVDTLANLREQSLSLNRKQEQLRTIRDEYGGHGVIITDTDGRIEYVNEAFEEQTGYSSDEVRGRTPSLLNSGEHDDTFYEELWETISSGEPWQSEVVNQRKNGERYVVDQTIVPAYGPDGEIEQFVAVNHEITELKRLQESLRQRSEQYEILNRVLRHDIRNDMTVVVGMLDELAAHVDGELSSVVARAQSSADHVVELTEVARDITKAMASDDASELQTMSLTSVLLTVGDNCRDTFDSVTIDLPEEPPEVTVEANELLSSVFRNLVNNAVQHNRSNDPVVSIELAVADGRVLVRIADNGPGVPTGIKEAVFDNEVKGLGSSGTGMGLYLVSTLVDLYGGEIWVEDNDPTGAVFCVELETVDVSPTDSTVVR